MRNLNLLMCTLVLLMAPLMSHADQPAAETTFELGMPFRDHMVLQRGIDLPIWGTAPPGAMITLTFDEQRKTTSADADGDWIITLDPLFATKLASADARPDAKTMDVTMKHRGQALTIELVDLVVGDIWFCAGQSNIAGKLKGSGTYQGEAADYPGFRHWTPTDEGSWTVCTPDREGAGEFKKTAFYFGRDVYRESLIPIGLVVSAVGGSNIESWLNAEPYEIGKHYTNLVEPIVGMGIRGMVWYQGESNANKGEPYGPLLKSLIEGYRDAWGQGDFPFYFVQLPGYGERTNEPGDQKPGWPRLRQEQLETLAIKNTGMAVTIDIGDKSVHPPNKVDTGRRLARLALYHDYDLKKKSPSGPLYESHKIEGMSIRVRFKHAQGLKLAEKQGINPPTAVEDKPVQCLSLQDERGQWHAAEGRVESDELVITSNAVAKPTAARYAYVPHPAGPLIYNKDGLPASPFETSEPEE